MTTTPAAVPIADDLAFAAHTAAAERIDLLARLEELESEGETVDPAEWPETAGPYCGCTTCDLREGLFAAWPVILDGITIRLRGAGHEQAAGLIERELTVPGYGRAA